MKKIAFFVAGFVVCSGVVFANQMGTMGLDFLAPTVSDKDQVLNPVEGEIIYERTATDANFWGRANSTWVSMGGVTSVIPSGAILPFGGTTAPAGYALCDGSAVSRTTYAALFAIIGTSFGAGDGSTTFNLPDLRGRFLRGVDGAAGRDPDSASRAAMATGGATGNNIGSTQGQATRKNGLGLSDPGHSHGVWYADTPAGGVLNAGGGAGVDLRKSTSTSSATTGISLTNGDNETRPVNAYVNYIIKL